MTYTIKFDLFVDDDNILSDNEIAEFLKDRIDTPTIDVDNVQVLEVND